MAVLWLWILSICCLSTYMNVRGFGAEEEEYRYKYVEEILQINCSLPAGSSGSVQNLEFTLENGLGLCQRTSDGLCDIGSGEVREVAEDTIQLNRRIRSLRDAGEYTCWEAYGDGTFHIVRDPLNVYVQYRPQTVQNVSCELDSRDDHVKCEWHQGVSYTDHMDWADGLHEMTLTASLRPPSGSAVQCPVPLSINDTECWWPASLLPSSSLYTLEVNVTNTEKRDSAVTAVNFTVRDVVKPSPVKSIRVQDKNSTCLTIALTHTRARDKVYSITMTTGPDRTLVKNHTGADSDVTLCGLRPYTFYTVSVKCRGADGEGPHGLWSDPRSRAVTTRQAEPGASFVVHEGGYVRHGCKATGRGDVTLLWKSVDPGDRHGVINGYRLVYSNTTVDMTTPSPPTGAVLPDLPCTHPVTVRVYSRTTAGFSTVYSSLRILPETPTPPVADFAVEIGKRVRAVWNTSRSDVTSHTDVSVDDGDVDEAGDDDAKGRGQQSGADDEVTIFRCLKNKTALVPTCLEEADWDSTRLSAGQLDLTPRFSPRSNPRDHVFGISRGARPIHWTSCLFPGNGEIQAPEEVRGEAVEGGLEVRWRRQQCTHANLVHVTGYRLHVCPAQHCADRRRMIEVEGWQRNQQTVEVEEGEDYVIRVQVVTFGRRLGPLSASVNVTVPERREKPWYIAGIIVPLAVLVIITACVIRYCCRTLRDRERRFAEPEDLLQNVGAEFDSRLQNGVDVRVNRDQDEEPPGPSPSSSSPTASSTTTTVLTRTTGRAAVAHSPPRSCASPSQPQKPGHGDPGSPQPQMSRDSVVFHVHAVLVEDRQGRLPPDSEGATVSLQGRLPLDSEGATVSLQGRLPPDSEGATVSLQGRLPPDREGATVSLQGRLPLDSEGATVLLLPVSQPADVAEAVWDLDDSDLDCEEAEERLVPLSQADGGAGGCAKHADGAVPMSNIGPYVSLPDSVSPAQNHHTTTC